MLNKESKIYVAGHNGLVGSAIWNNLKARGYENLVGRSHKELKAIQFISDDQRKQLKNYLNITHCPYGMLINFSPDRLYSEWYERYSDGTIERIKLY